MNPVESGITIPSVTTNVWTTAGNLSVSAIPEVGYTFLFWIATGLITFAFSSSNSTTAAIGGAGIIEANFSALPISLVPSLTVLLASVATIVAILAFAAIAFRHDKRKSGK